MTGMAALAACVPGADEQLRAFLPSYELHFVRNVDEACRALREYRFELLVIGVQFDEARMFDMLVRARSLDQCRNMPILCVHDSVERLPAGLARVLDVAVKAFGARAFLDIRDGVPAIAERSGTELAA